MTGDRCVPNWNLLCERELHDCDYTIDRSPREFLYEVILERLSNRCAATRAQIDELFKKNREETCKKKYDKMFLRYFRFYIKLDTLD